MGNDLEMKSQFPIGLLALALFLTAATFTWFALKSYDSYHHREDEKRHLQLQTLEGTITHLDEVLTMSARMAAATGNVLWEQRYRRFEPQLDAAIKEAMDLAPYLHEVIAQTDAANIKLVEMENQAFALVREGRFKEAQAVLFTEEYESLKKIYADGMKQFTGLLHDHVNAHISTEGRGAFASLVVTITILPVLLFVWFTVFRIIRRREKHQKLVGEIGRDCLQMGDLGYVLDRAVQRIVYALEVELCGILRLDDKSESLLLVSGTGWKQGVVGQAALTADTGSLAGYTLKVNKPIIVKELRGETRFDGSPLLSSHGVRSGISVPMVSRGRGIGVLEVHSRKNLRFTPDDVEFLEIVSNLIAVAIDRRQAEEALRENERRLRRQNKVHRQFIKQNTSDFADLKTTLRNVTETTALTLETERASVWVYNDDRSKIHCIDLYERTANQHSEGMELTEAIYPSYFKALESERAIVAHDAHTDPATKEFAEPYLSPLGISSMLDAPIRIGGRVVGVICHEHVGPPRYWTLDEQNFAGSMADLVSQVLGVENNKRAEGALHTSQKRFEGILQIAQDAVISVDEGQRIIVFNRGAERIFGYAAQEVMGQQLGLLLPSRFSSVHSQHISEFSKSPNIARMMGERREIFGRRKDGTEFPAEATISKLELGDEKVFTVILRDITERKMAEQKLKTLAVNLKRSNRELQDFTIVASHDLQEPLRKIQTFANSLRAKCGQALSDQGRDYLERMQNAAHRMHVLINDLLAFSKLTTKSQPYVETNLAEVARQVLCDLEVAIEREGGRVEVGDLPSIEADPTQMRQLIQNLLSNALKFHKKEEKPIIKIEGHLLKDREDHLEENSSVFDQCQIKVKDNGIGFDEKYVDRIFNVFQRLHSRSEYEGTGIGLAICRKIAERHGGTITAESKPGQGATFVVTLPIKHPRGGISG